MNPFFSCSTLDEKKSVYRREALKAHPDTGGTNEKMRLLTEQYERAISEPDHPKPPEQPKTYTNNGSSWTNTTYHYQPGSGYRSHPAFDGDVFILRSDPRLTAILKELYPYTERNHNCRLNLQMVDFELKSMGFITKQRYSQLLAMKQECVNQERVEQEARLEQERLKYQAKAHAERLERAALERDIEYRVRQAIKRERELEEKAFQKKEASLTWWQKAKRWISEFIDS